jgi:uncharacterized integral membrane protein
MRIKTIIIILITILLTVVLMQNKGTVRFTFLFMDFYVSKLVMLAIVSGIAFVLGYLVGRPKRIKRLGGEFSDTDLEKGESNTLSDEDREYIGD